MWLDLWQGLIGGEHDKRDQLSGFVVQTADRVDIAVCEVSQDLHELRLSGAGRQHLA
jgi:hypothetical protein